MHVKVRHGAVTWNEMRDVYGKQQEVTETAFRGMIVDMPPNEVARLKPLGAVVDVGTELPLGGKLTPVPSTASDAELVAWASVANRSEIIAEIQRQPALGDRLLAAFEIVQQQLADQNELLGGLRPEIEDAQAKAEREAKEAEEEAANAEELRQADLSAAAAASDAAAAALAASTVQSTGAGTDGGSSDDELEDPDEVVKGNVSEVSKHLSEHPEQASAIMEAENRRAAAATEEREKHPRQGVINAVEAAAAHHSTQ